MLRFQLIRKFQDPELKPYQIPHPPPIVFKQGDLVKIINYLRDEFRTFCVVVRVLEYNTGFI